MKDQIISLHNDYQETSVNSNIKSKTNAAYKMMSFLTKSSIQKAKRETQELREDTKLLSK